MPMVTLDYVRTVGTPKLTKLFRDELIFGPLEEIVIPSFDGKIKLASVGCSDGREPYSVLVQNWRQRNRLKIDAFDHSQDVLNLARRGIYEANDWDSHRLGRSKSEGKAFEVIDKLDDNYRLIRFTDEAKRHIAFLPHDIYKSPLPNTYDVVLLANVLYHYSFPEIKHILENVVESMNPSGWLLCESHNPHGDDGKEQYWRFMRDLSQFGLEKQPYVFNLGPHVVDETGKTKIYRKK